MMITPDPNTDTGQTGGRDIRIRKQALSKEKKKEFERGKMQSNPSANLALVFFHFIPPWVMAVVESGKEGMKTGHWMAHG